MQTSFFNSIWGQSPFHGTWNSARDKLNTKDVQREASVSTIAPTPHNRHGDSSNLSSEDDYMDHQFFEGNNEDVDWSIEGIQKQTADATDTLNNPPLQHVEHVHQEDMEDKWDCDHVPEHHARWKAEKRGVHDTQKVVERSARHAYHDSHTRENKKNLKQIHYWNDKWTQKQSNKHVQKLRTRRRSYMRDTKMEELHGEWEGTQCAMTEDIIIHCHEETETEMGETIHFPPRELLRRTFFMISAILITTLGCISAVLEFSLDSLGFMFWGWLSVFGIARAPKSKKRSKEMDELRIFRAGTVVYDSHGNFIPDF